MYGHVKLGPASETLVLDRNKQIETASKAITKDQLDSLPEFFHTCFSRSVLSYLLAVRETLCWQTDKIDSTLMALILVYLHGNRGRALSNQMRQSKAMAPDYSLLWWKKHNLAPPEIAPVSFIEQRIKWRYNKGVPELQEGELYLGDSTTILDEVSKNIEENPLRKFDLLFTSPPYYSITSYHYDQWLRLWMLGGSDTPSKSGGEWQDGFWSKSAYQTLLKTVFSKCANVLKEDAVIFVRTDARQYTLETTEKILIELFPHKELTIQTSPLVKSNQTALYGDKSEKPGEIDIILS